jgi:hypothetical protein
MCVHVADIIFDLVYKINVEAIHDEYFVARQLIVNTMIGLINCSTFKQITNTCTSAYSLLYP